MGMKKVQESITPYDDKTFNTMVPGPFIKFMRTCKIWQLIRFIVINLKMLKVVAKSH